MQALSSSALDLSSWNMNSSGSYEEDFLETDPIMEPKSTSEFDSYVSNYNDYESLMHKNMSTMKDLDAAAEEFFMSPKQNTMASPANTSLLFHNPNETEHIKSPLSNRGNGLGLSFANPMYAKNMLSNDPDFSMSQETDMLDISQFSMLQSSGFGVSEDLSQMTVTPATLAKYSKILQMNNIPHVPQQPNINGPPASPHRSTQSPTRVSQSPSKVTKASPSKHKKNRHGGSLASVDTSNLISTDVYLPPSTPSSHHPNGFSSSPGSHGIHVPSSPIASPYLANGGHSELASVNASPQHRQTNKGRHSKRPSSSVLLMPLQNGEPEADVLRQRLTLHIKESEGQSKSSEIYQISPKPGFSPTLDQFDHTPETASVPQFYNQVTPNPGSLEMFANGSQATDMVHPLMPPPPASPTKPNKSPHLSSHLMGTGPQLYQPNIMSMPGQMALITPQQQLMLQQHHQQQLISPEHFQQIYALEQAAALGGHSQVFQVLNGAIVPGNSATDPLAWQPVLTTPTNQGSEEIIKHQQYPIVQPSNRKSCLPPGKVDSYLSGPNEEGQFLCLFPNCGKFFKRRYNVRSHIQTHLCDRPYLCDVCQATFVRPHDLRRHEKCHQEEKPFKCPCGKTFTRHDALQRHRGRLICEGGIEIPGKPKKPPGKRGRPRKNPDPNQKSTATKQEEADDETTSASSSSADATPADASDLGYDQYEYDDEGEEKNEVDEATNSEHTLTDEQLDAGESSGAFANGSSSSSSKSVVNSTSSRLANSTTATAPPKTINMSAFNLAAPSAADPPGSESDHYSSYTSSPDEMLDPSLLHSHEQDKLSSDTIEQGGHDTATALKSEPRIEDDSHVVDPMFLESWSY